MHVQDTIQLHISERMGLYLFPILLEALEPILCYPAHEACCGGHIANQLIDFCHILRSQIVSLQNCEEEFLYPFFKKQIRRSNYDLVETIDLIKNKDHKIFDTIRFIDQSLDEAPEDLKHMLLQLSYIMNFLYRLERDEWYCELKSIS